MSGRPPSTPAREFAKRFALAHFLAYPLTFAVALATMPLALLLREDALLEAAATGAKTGLVGQVAANMGLSALEAAQLEIVLGTLLWLSLAVFVSLHLAALPWAIAAAKAARSPSAVAGLKRGYTLFVAVTTSLVGLLLLAGALSWLWMLTL